MKKISLLVIFTVIGFSLFAQTENKPAAQPLSENLLALQTANALARYGYSAQSASALIGAAEIFAQIRTQPLGVQPERQQSGSTAVETPEFTPANLLADARRIAGRDATMIAWANEVERSLNTTTRGAVGGPKWAVDVIPNGGTHTYDISFRAGEYSEVAISGNGASDLDLYIYDGYGNLVIGDEGYSDQSTLWFVASRTGVFRIVIKNWGPRANRYGLYTN
jgi:hypothetical protein